MRQQVGPNSSFLAAGAGVGVPNQSYVLHRLNAHHAFQRSVLLVSPELYTVLDFMIKFVPGHVRFCPAVLRDDISIGACAIVDDGPNHLNVSIVTTADHALVRSPLTAPEAHVRQGT